MVVGRDRGNGAGNRENFSGMRKLSGAADRRGREERWRIEGLGRRENEELLLG